MLIASYGHSDVGFVREKNEDSYPRGRGVKEFMRLPMESVVFRSGALASRLAVRFFGSLVHNAEICSTEEEFRQIAHSVHQNIVECGSLVGGENGIGTTFSGFAHNRQQAVVRPCRGFFDFFEERPWREQDFEESHFGRRAYSKAWTGSRS